MGTHTCDGMNRVASTREFTGGFETWFPTGPGIIIDLHIGSLTLMDTVRHCLYLTPVPSLPYSCNLFCTISQCLKCILIHDLLANPPTSPVVFVYQGSLEREISRYNKIRNIRPILNRCHVHCTVLCIVQVNIFGCVCVYQNI